MASLPEPTPPNLEDIDIYCLKCGYNLRGLSGDPRRCPECFYMNPMGDALPPAELISTQLRRMETAPATALVCFAILLVAAVPLLAMLPDLIDNNPPRAERSCCCNLFMPAAVVGWVSSVVRFRNSCRKRPGWGRVLVRYHIIGLAAMVGVSGLVLFVGLLLQSLIGASERSGVTALLYTAAVFILVVGTVVLHTRLLPRLRTLARGDMDQLQREVAVEITRETLRKNLAKGG